MHRLIRHPRISSDPSEIPHPQTFPLLAGWCVGVGEGVADGWVWSLPRHYVCVCVCARVCSVLG